MFCPKCRSEYIEEVTECPECAVALIAELAEEPPPDITSMATVFTTNNSIEANFIKSLLGSNNIKCFIANEYLISINILLSNAIPITVAVNKQDEAKSREVIEQYYRDMKEPS